MMPLVSQSMGLQYSQTPKWLHCATCAPLVHPLKGHWWGMDRRDARRAPGALAFPCGVGKHPMFVGGA